MANQKIITTEDIEKRLAEERTKQESMPNVKIEGVTIYADNEEEIKEIIEKTDLLRKSFEKELGAAAGNMLKATLQTWMKNGRIKFAK